MDRFSACRIFIEDRDILVSVDGECERSWDGSRAHIEAVRHNLRTTAVFLQCLSLFDPKSMLLIDHDESEVGKSDGILDEGMRSENDIGLSIFESFARIFFHTRRERSDEKI